MKMKKEKKKEKEKEILQILILKKKKHILKLIATHRAIFDKWFFFEHHGHSLLMNFVDLLIDTSLRRGGWLIFGNGVATSQSIDSSFGIIILIWREIK